MYLFMFLSQMIVIYKSRISYKNVDNLLRLSLITKLIFLIIIIHAEQSFLNSFFEALINDLHFEKIRKILTKQIKRIRNEKSRFNTIH